MHSRRIYLTRSAVLVAVGLILPVVFHYISLGGQVFLPMHIPVLIGGFLLSPAYAATVGLVIPVLSSIFTGMPQMPFALIMMAELCTYGFVVSIVYRWYIKSIYAALIIGMIAGRAVSCIGNYVLYAFIAGKPFPFAAYLNTITLMALPGIAIQFLLIPALITLIQKYDEYELNISYKAE